MDRPSVYAYLDYRSFLKDMVKYLRTQGRYSVRLFAAQVGFGSSNYLKLIMDGKRSLTSKTAVRVAHGLNLRKAEVPYFESLIRLNESKDNLERDVAIRKLFETRGAQKTRQLEAAEYEFYSNWKIVALYTAVGTNVASKELKAVAQRLDLSDAHFRSILELLKRLGLIEKKKRRWIQKHAILKTPQETKSLTVRAFHRSMIQQALAATDNIPPQERDLSCLTLPLTQKEFRVITRRLAELREEINSRYADSSKADKIYQINFQVFPLLELPTTTGVTHVAKKN